MPAYATVSEAVTGLRNRGYVQDFNLRENCLECTDGKCKAGEFSMVELYRFEGNTDPADEAIVYAIESQNGLKGILVYGYGILDEAISTAWLPN